jgi:hypothetical protein
MLVVTFIILNKQEWMELQVLHTGIQKAHFPNVNRDFTAYHMHNLNKREKLLFSDKWHLLHDYWLYCQKW